MKVLLVILLAATVVSGTPIEYDDCGSDASISVVDITPCPDDIPCPLKRGGNAKIQIKFTPTKDYDSVESVCHGVIGGLPLPFKLEHPDGCKPDSKSGLTCPLKKGTEYMFTYQVVVIKCSYSCSCNYKIHANSSS